MSNMCSPLFFKVFYNLGLDKKLFFLTVRSAAIQDIFVSFRISSEFNKKPLNLSKEKMNHALSFSSFILENFSF